MSSSPTNSRKVLLINPRFQISFIAYTVGVSAFAVAIFYAANAFFFYKFMQKGREIGLPDDHIFFRFISEQRVAMDMIFVVTAMAVLAVLTISGLYLSHRVAGPMYRFQKHLRALTASRDLRAVKFRENDYFPEVAESFNEMVEANKGKQLKSAS